MTALFIIIGINLFLQLCILGYIYNLEQESKALFMELIIDDEETHTN